jgi:hypothetical protein
LKSFSSGDFVLVPCFSVVVVAEEAEDSDVGLRTSLQPPEFVIVVVANVGIVVAIEDEDGE